VSGGVLYPLFVPPFEMDSRRSSETSTSSGLESGHSHLPLGSENGTELTDEECSHEGPEVEEPDE
jgi:hypothetical protein